MITWSRQSTIQSGYYRVGQCRVEQPGTDNLYRSNNYYQLIECEWYILFVFLIITRDLNRNEEMCTLNTCHTLIVIFKLLPHHDCISNSYTDCTSNTYHTMIALPTPTTTQLYFKLLPYLDCTSNFYHTWLYFKHLPHTDCMSSTYHILIALENLTTHWLEGTRYTNTDWAESRHW